MIETESMSIGAVENRHSVYFCGRLPAASVWYVYEVESISSTRITYGFCVKDSG